MISSIIDNNNSGIINNYGMIYQAESSVRNYGTINNYFPGTINNDHSALHNYSSGTINNYGTINNKKLLRNQGEINNFGRLYNSNEYLEGELANYGTINNNSGATLENYDAIYNYGTINNNSGATFNNNGRIEYNGFINNNGIFNQQSGSLSAANIANNGTFNFTGGTLSADSFGNTGLFQGAGTIATDIFTNAGTLAPGYSPGMLTIEGNYIQTTGSVLAIELASATSYDILNVTGEVSLAGMLKVILYDGYKPAYGTCFDFLTAGLINGEFDSITGPAGYKWSVAYLDLAGSDGIIDTARLTANNVPVPAALWLFAPGLLGIIGMRRKWRIK